MVPYAARWLVLEFPSPCGEKVGINTQAKVKLDTRLLPFPSPCGEKVGINDSYEEAVSILNAVSVPLRGKGRDQRRLQCLLSSTVFQGFRPLAGKR